MAAIGGQGCSKANGRRNRKHAGKYSAQKVRCAKRKDRNVFRSSHGKFKNVKELEAHRNKTA